LRLLPPAVCLCFFIGKKTVPISPMADEFSGVTTPSLTITNIQVGDIGNYRLIVSNAYSADISTTANLSVVPIVIWGAFGATGPPATLTNAIAIAAQGYQGERVNLGLKSDARWRLGQLLRRLWQSQSYSSGYPVERYNVVRFPRIQARTGA